MDWKMDWKRFQPIAEIFKSRINTPLIWGVFLFTFALTALFYFSQKQQAEVYTRYIETLSDYKFFAARSMQKLEKIRVFPDDDTAELLASLRGLRETAVSVSEASERARTMDWMPDEQKFSSFERAVLTWVAAVRRYVPARAAWLDSAKNINEEFFALHSTAGIQLSRSLDSARMGFGILPDSSLLKKIPTALGARYTKLLNENAEQASLWNRIDNDIALVRCENLIQDFKMQSLKNRELKFWIQQIFYLISIVLLLFTLFFVIRSRK